MEALHTRQLAHERRRGGWDGVCFGHDTVEQTSLVPESLSDARRFFLPVCGKSDRSLRAGPTPAGDALDCFVYARCLVLGTPGRFGRPAGMFPYR
jgi:hypothetical protein